MSRITPIDTRDVGSNKEKRRVRLIKLERRIGRAVDHARLTARGVPRSVDGNKLGLRKRLRMV